MSAAPRKLSAAFTKANFRGSVFEHAALIEGKLKKYSQGVFKRWQERYFVVSAHVSSSIFSPRRPVPLIVCSIYTLLMQYLKYYTDENKIQKDLKGTIDLNECVTLEKVGKTDIKIMLTQARETLLRCTSEENQEEWYDVLDQIMKSNEKAPDEEEEIIWQKRAEEQEAVKAACTIPDTEEERMKTRPMIITVQNAKGLEVGKDKKVLNPLMMITVLGSSVEAEDGREDSYPEQITNIMTAAKTNELNPEWNEVVMLPAVTGDMVLLFTCVDFEGGSYTFLGQSCLRLQETGHWRQKEALTLNLAEVDDALPPRDGMGKPFEFESAPNNGEFTVTIEPVDLNEGFTSQVKKVGGKEALNATKVGSL
jgi:hypothetical protein